MNTSACSLLPTCSESGTWFRAIQAHLLPTALATSHTTGVASRFSPGSLASPSFEILYLAENHMVALFEVQALLGSPWVSGGVIPHPRRAWTILNVNVNLQKIVDLTDPVTFGLLATNAQELTGDWRGYQFRGPSASIKGPTGIAPTQELGAALARTSGLEGFRSYSARLPDMKVLAVFPKNLRPVSSVEFWDPMTAHTIQLV